MGKFSIEEFKSFLFMLEDDNERHIAMLISLAKKSTSAADVVKVILIHVYTCPPSKKLASLHLIDSLLKNFGGNFSVLFSQHIAALFNPVFQKVDKPNRSKLHKMRLGWHFIFPSNILYQLDITIKQLNPAWSITAKPSGISPRNVAKSAFHPLYYEDYLKLRRQLLTGTNIAMRLSQNSLWTPATRKEGLVAKAARLK